MKTLRKEYVEGVIAGTSDPYSGNEVALIKAWKNNMRKSVPWECDAEGEWLCQYCGTNNPEKVKTKSYLPMRKVSKCLSCGASKGGE